VNGKSATPIDSDSDELFVDPRSWLRRLNVTLAKTNHPTSLSALEPDEQTYSNTERLIGEGTIEWAD